MGDLSPPEIEAVKKRLNAIEVQVWDHMRHHRMFQGCALIELWQILHKESQMRLPNPFQDLAGLAQRKYRESLSREAK